MSETIPLVSFVLVVLYVAFPFFLLGRLTRLQSALESINTELRAIRKQGSGPEKPHMFRDPPS